MTLFFRFFLLLIFPLFITAGCISHQGHQTAIQEDSDSASLTLVENDVCLNEELQQLQQTGSWSHEKNQSLLQANTENTYDFPIIINPQVEMYLELIQTKQRKQFARWLERSSYYKPMMEAELKKAGLPLDLMYLAMIESGYNQTAYSGAKAVGLWQFMKGTGKHCGLTIDKYVDERRNALKSTRAATAYLTELYNDFKDWHLAVAAYNAGPGKVRIGLKKYGVDNFWDLANKKYLRLETKRYVPKLIATIIIAKNPEKYGFTSLNYQPAMSHDTVSVGPGLPLSAVAAITETDIKTIRKLNLELRKDRTPYNVTKYQVNIPSGTQKLARANLPRLHSMVSTGYKIHIVRKNESMKSICRRYNINQATLSQVNKLQSSSLPNGKRLKIPYSTVTYQILPEGDSEKLLAYKNSLILHKIKRGETISKIARKYRIPAELIVSWNGLSSIHKVRAGQQLALYINRTDAPVSTAKNSIAKNKRIRATPKNKTAEQRNASIKLITAAVSKTKKIKKDAVWYMVQDGDSLWAIARKFNTSTTTLRQLNNLKNNLIHPGNKIKITES